jgi:hypothetical protein
MRLSRTGTSNLKGYAGYEFDDVIQRRWSHYAQKSRILNATLGRYLTRQSSTVGISTCQPIASSSYIYTPTGELGPPDPAIPTSYDSSPCGQLLTSCFASNRTVQSLYQQLLFCLDDPAHNTHGADPCLTPSDFIQCQPCVPPVCGKFTPPFVPSVNCFTTPGGISICNGPQCLQAGCSVLIEELAHALHFCQYRKSHPFQPLPGGGSQRPDGWGSGESCVCSETEAKKLVPGHSCNTGDSLDCCLSVCAPVPPYFGTCHSHFLAPGDSDKSKVAACLAFCQEKMATGGCGGPYFIPDFGS